VAGRTSRGLLLTAHPAPVRRDSEAPGPRVGARRASARVPQPARGASAEGAPRDACVGVHQDSVRRAIARQVRRGSCGRVVIVTTHSKRCKTPPPPPRPPPPHPLLLHLLLLFLLLLLLFYFQSWFDCMFSMTLLPGAAAQERAEVPARAGVRPPRGVPRAVRDLRAARRGVQLLQRLPGPGLVPRRTPGGGGRACHVALQIVYLARWEAGMAMALHPRLGHSPLFA